MAARFFWALGGGLAGVLAAGSAAADDGAWTVDVAAASEYVSKGAGRSAGNPHVALQIQRRVTQTVYAGVWTGSVSSPLGANGETHLYMGWRPRVGDWSLDIRPTFKVLAGAREGFTTEQWEVRADAARPLAGGRLRLRVEHTADGFGPSEGSTWMEASLTHPIGEAGWSVLGGLGRREQTVGRDYTAWNLGVQRRMTDSLSVDLRWIDTDQRDAGREYDGRLVLGMTMSLK